jgi:alkylation response protein AidB-like acyl-CoA dehydrogenase
MNTNRVTTVPSKELDELVRRLRELSGASADESHWPRMQLETCARFGVFEWFAGQEWHGQEWNDADLMRGYLALSAACLTTTFIITQRTGAYQRIERSENQELKRRLLPDLVAGTSFATVGISHLTTSRRHLKPVLRAEDVAGRFRLDGYSPWVTGADQAQHLVVGATLDDGRQILVAVPADLPGITVQQPASLVGLAGSRTGRVEFERVWVDQIWLLAGPVHEVMKQGVGARTGGLQTSALALGLAKSAIDYLHGESGAREALASPAVALSSEWAETMKWLMAAAGETPICSDADLRSRANSLVLRATQAALTAAKGAGYVAGHPAGRWCREALFFLVWSCPQPVLAANLCEFAGIDG